MKDKKDPGRSTALIAHGLPAAGRLRAVQPPVHKASTVVFADVAALRARSWKEKTGYTYGLLGTPTTFTLEERIATLEGGRQTVLVRAAWRDHGPSRWPAEGGRRALFPGQRLRPEQGLRPATSSRAGHRASLLRPDGSAIARRRDRRTRRAWSGWKRPAR
jgi:cystathionine beta-lyase